MGASPSAFWGWPGWRHIAYTAWLELLAGIWLELVYGMADAVTAHRALRIPVHVAAELDIPFVPGLAIVYLTIHLLFIGAPFILRTRTEIRALMWTLATVIGLAGVGFLLVPAELAFPKLPDNLGMLGPAFRLADWLNFDYNLVPSGHVALSVACVAAFASRARMGGAILLWTWALAIATSTLLTHQHHVLDMVTGFALGLGASRLIYGRLATAAADSTAPSARQPSPALASARRTVP